MKLDTLVSQVITMPNIDHFTAVEVRTAYLVLSGDNSLDRANIRKFVYGELCKLVKGGLLKKTTSNIKGVSRFHKTGLFDPNVFIEQINDNQKKIDIRELSGLKQRAQLQLKECNVELLKGVGALETYLDLWKFTPEKADYFRAKYLSTQERNHILEGKIDALQDSLKTTSENK